jgi:hypothetical protein
MQSVLTMLCSIQNHWIQVSFSKGPNRVSHTSPEDGNRSNFRNVVCSRYLHFNTELWAQSINPVISRVKIVTGDENLIFRRLAVLLEYDEGE